MRERWTEFKVDSLRGSSCHEQEGNLRACLSLEERSVGR